MSFCFPLGGECRRFLSGDLDFTSLNQERNSIPNESIKLETLSRGFLHGGLLRNSENDTEGASQSLWGDRGAQSLVWALHVDDDVPCESPRNERACQDTRLPVGAFKRAYRRM